MSRAGLCGVRGSLTLLRRGMCQKKADSAFEYFYRCRNLHILVQFRVEKTERSALWLEGIVKKLRFWTL